MKLLDVILVDDCDDDCGLFVIAADKAGVNMRLQIVTSGQEAIEYLEGRGVYADRARHPVPKLVVLDFDTRLNGGFDFLNWRRVSAFYSSLPVLILSEFAYTDTMETNSALGAGHFMAKPLELEGWETVVRRIWELGVERSESLNRQLELAVDGPDAQDRLPDSR